MTVYIYRMYISLFAFFIWCMCTIFFDRTWYTLAVFKVFPGWLFSLVWAIGLSSCHFTLLYCLTADVLSINCIINTMITLAYLQLKAAVFKILQSCKNVNESWKVICNFNFRSWVLCQGTKGLVNENLFIKHFTTFVTKVFYSIFKLFSLQPWDFDISLICYDNANFTGEWKRFTEYTPDLGPLEFDNRIEACIFTGL